MVKESFKKYYDLFKPVMIAMQSLIGDSSEFILHDLSELQNSVTLVVGNITGRQIGAPTTNLVMEALEKYGDQAEDMLGYLSVSKDGRRLKSYTIFIRDENGKIVGCYCCNIDLTEFNIMENFLKNFCAINDPSENEKKSKTEVFAQEISDVVEDIIKYEISRYDRPVPHMNRADKIQLVTLLESKGVFDVKGAADIVSHYMGVSVFTVYNYLKEIRSSYRNGQAHNIDA
ncbi:MAG: transcriptional regulator [Lachnospiraceae bacterium]|nr:transcriptional regulator [Lachnospiraceae bacterium]